MIEKWEVFLTWLRQVSEPRTIVWDDQLRPASSKLMRMFNSHSELAEERVGVGPSRPNAVQAVHDSHGNKKIGNDRASQLSSSDESPFQTKRPLTKLYANRLVTYTRER
jgi:hypothetical protein